MKNKEKIYCLQEHNVIYPLVDSWESPAERLKADTMFWYKNKLHRVLQNLGTCITALNCNDNKTYQLENRPERYDIIGNQNDETFPLNEKSTSKIINLK